MRRKERNWCLAYAGFLAALTTVPYLLGFAIQGDDWVFTGFVFGVEDGNSYIAKMLHASQGAWLFRTPYTSFQQQGVIAYLPYVLLGKLAVSPGLHEQLTVLFHIFRILVTPLAVFANYQFIALFVTSHTWRRWATVLATAGGGLGWLIILLGRSSWLGSLPLDFHSPETFGFLAYFGLPHLILARGLLLIGLRHYLLSTESPKAGWMAGFYFLILALVQPLSVVSAYAVLSVHQVFILGRSLRRGKWRHWLPWAKSGVRAGLVPSPIVIYLMMVFSRDQFLRAWSSQNRILSPHPAHYLIAYGVLAFPAIIGGRELVKKLSIPTLLPLSWVIALPVLAYAPYNLQRRLPEGVWVALVVLAVVGMESWNQKHLRKINTMKYVILASSLLSSAVLLIGGIGVALGKGEPVYRPAKEVEGFLWLEGEIDSWPIVLSAYETGNALPAWVHVRVVIGHGPETANLDVLLPQVKSFYSDEMKDEERSDFMFEMGVDYVWFGPHERKLGEWTPSESDSLTLIYQHGDYQIYQTTSSP